MQIQVRTDNHIEGHEKLLTYVESTVTSSLNRFKDRLTHVEVHLSDKNGGKGGPDDKRCMMEARLEGRQPTAVTHDAENIDQAVHGAANKLQHALERIIGKQREH